MKDVRKDNFIFYFIFFIYKVIKLLLVAEVLMDGTSNSGLCQKVYVLETKLRHTKSYWFLLV